MFFKKSMKFQLISERPIIVLSIMILSAGFSISDAFAYLDPASGSLILQMVVGALVGVGITIKVFWYKIKEKISRKI